MKKETNKFKVWLHRNIVCRLTQNPPIRALGLISGIKYKFGIAKKGVDYD